jgi:hypothetical protein
VDDGWKKLLAVVKTNLPVCGSCGQVLAENDATRFCWRCGEPAGWPAPSPGRWLARFFSSLDSRGRGFQFEGDVSPQGFDITRIISYRNSCIPVIRGRFERSNAGMSIVIDMNMHPLGYIFLIGGMGLSFGIPSIAFIGRDQGRVSALLAIVPIAAPCFIFLVSWVAFTWEANVARTMLIRIWESATLPT